MSEFIQAEGFTLPSGSGHAHAARLLHSLGATLNIDAFAVESDADSESSEEHHRAWAQSGAMALTGEAGKAPLLIPSPLALSARGALLAFKTITPTFAPDFDAAGLLGERAAIAGYSRQGNQSAGGSCRLLRTADGCIAINLPRNDDWKQLPALLSGGEMIEPIEAKDWDALARNLARQNSASVLDLARLLGLAVSDACTVATERPWIIAQHTNKQAPPDTSPLIVDLSALWAGPLCASLLGFAGARVIKVESRQRPDGARAGPVEFFDLMNGNKESLALDLHHDQGRTQLKTLLQRADIVIESSRPRALRQMGISAEALLASKPGKVWVSITGYGRDADNELRIAYGDDAGVAAGLSQALYEHYGQYLFCGDALADPLTGLHAAVAASAAWYSGRGGLLDISLQAVTRFCSEPRYPVDVPVTRQDNNWYVESGRERIEVSEPYSRCVKRKAPALGADNTRLMTEFSLA